MGNKSKNKQLGPVGTKEVRSIDPTTGAAKGVKIARFDLIPVGPLEDLAVHFGKGCEKYAARNWEAGYSWSKSFAALCRHLFAFWRGEDFDTDEGPLKGQPHITAVAWHAFVLREYMKTHPEMDDRVKAKGEGLAKVVADFKLLMELSAMAEARPSNLYSQNTPNPNKRR